MSAHGNLISPAENINALIEFYKDNVAYQRHHEDIRFKGSQLIIALVAALIASLKFTSGNPVNYVIAISILLLGILGILQVMKHTERADRHAIIARVIRKNIGEVADKMARPQSKSYMIRGLATIRAVPGILIILISELDGFGIHAHCHCVRRISNWYTAL